MDIVEKIYSLYVKGHRICTDSRSIDKGDIFFALKGETFNGNRFAVQAIERGAEIALVDDPFLKEYPKVIFVPDVLEFLQALASYHRSKLNIPIIALTGSNGKTTTKELITCVLKDKFKTFSTQGNLNNHIGVPLTILSVPVNAEMAVVELGANHEGEISKLCEIVKPTHGLITNIGKAHLEGFGSIDGVKRAKSELYNFLFKSDGKVFIDTNNKELNEIIIKFPFKNNVIPYGRDLYHVNRIASKKGKLSFNFSVSSGITFSIKTQFAGEYNIENILAAFCVSNYFNVDNKKAIQCIESYIPSNNRSQIINTKSNTLIIDAYNANPSSMEFALHNFSNTQHRYPKVAILGEMLELGKYTESEHNRIAEMATRLGFELLVFVGNGFKQTQHNHLWFSTSKKCLKYFESNPLTKKFILIKGSRGVKMDIIADYL
jgi:UDP-N-acetylmuramoyl-tripeptide--D-alanyl-D-alanine ligase